MKHLLAGLVACSFLAGCSGGAGTSLPTSQPIVNTPANPSVPAAKKRGAAAFTIVIPKATAASKKRLARIRSSARTGRRPLYVSAGTQSLVVLLTAVNGTPVSTPVDYAINVGGAGCTSSSGTTTCTLVVPVAAGTDSFTIITYDQAQISVNPTSPLGDILSEQTTIVPVVADTANAVSVPIVLDAVPTSMSISPAGSGYYWYGSQSVPISVALRDAANYLIVGPGAFIDANGNSITVTLADSDATSTSLSATNFSTTTTLANATLTYTGGPLAGAATLTASAPGLTSATTTFAASVKSGTLFVATGSGTEVWDTTASPPVYVSTIGTGQQTGVALAANGTFYQTDWVYNSVTRYVPGATTPIAQYNYGLQCYSLAATTSGRIFIDQQGAPALYVDPTSQSTFSVAGTGTYQIGLGVAVDPASQRLLTSDGAHRKIFAYGSNLAQTPTAVINLSTLNILPGLMAFRPDGTLFVVDTSTQNVYSIATPLGTPGTPTLVETGLSSVTGIAFDAAGDMFLAGPHAIYKIPAATAFVNNPSAYFTPVSANDAQMVMSP